MPISGMPSGFGGKRFGYTNWDDELADDDDTEDPECEFLNGQTRQQYREFMSCRRDAEADEDCDAENETLEASFINAEGEEVVYIVGFHVHCAEYQ